MHLPSKDQIGQAMQAGVLTVLLSAFAVPLVWQGPAFALWGGLVAATFAGVFLLAASLPATACFCLFFAGLRIAGLSEFLAKVLAFVIVTALSLVLLSQMPFEVTGNVPLRVWATPMVMAILTALFVFPKVKQSIGGSSQ